MSNTGHILPITGAIGISLAAGSNITFTLLTIPPLLQSPPALLATQWSQLFYRGASTVVPVAMTSGLTFALLSYREFQRGDPRARAVAQAYAVAAVCSLGMVPYTAIVMGKTNSSLISAAEKVVKQGVSGGDGVPGFDVHALVRRWSSLNLGRGLMLLTGAVASIYATTINA